MMTHSDRVGVLFGHVSYTLKLIGLLLRRPDLSLAQFSRHWRTVHRDHAVRLIAPGIMLGYTQNHRLDEDGDIEGLPSAGDGFPELWIADEQALTRIAGAPEYLDGAYLDEPNFMDGRSQSIIAQEHVIRAGSGPLAAATCVKAMVFFRRAPSVATSDFATRFVRAPHPVLLSCDSQPLRLTRHVALPREQDIPSSDAISGFDGIEASYWPDLATFRTAWRTRDPSAEEGHGWRAAAGVLVHEEPVLVPKHVEPLSNEYVA